MERRLEAELRDLKTRILTMGGFVESAVESAILALKEKNPKHFENIRKLETKINEAHIEVDNKCLEIIARQAPVAMDLRFILSAFKINADLERMGDQTMNVVYNLEDFFKSENNAPEVGLFAMAGKVQAMIRKSLDAFVRNDPKLAQEVLESDDEVDAHKNRVFDALIPYMQQNPAHIRSSLGLILVARNLERVADHATNIAEDVIFTSTGEDIRHGLGFVSTE